MPAIKKVAVIGAGNMGAGIAAHVANAGIPAVLLDIVPPGANDRNVVAAAAIERMQKADPAPLMSKRAAKLITPGNIEDHLGLLADCDWIVEAVIEKLDVKRDLYQRIDTVRKKGSVVSSNTSTIPLSTLTEGMSPAFTKDFVITHFFNPPRYMRLLEVVKGPKTRDTAVKAVSEFADFALGKSVIACKDRPGFIANRIGIFWMQNAVIEAFDLGIRVEEADAIFGKPFGIPKTGIFGLLDLTGIDLSPHVMASMVAALPKDDPLQALNRDIPLMRKMIADGYTGRKGKGGFYRINRANGGKVKEVIDLATGTYAPERKAELDELSGGKPDLRKLMSSPSKAGRYAWRVWAAVLSYVLGLVPEVVDDIASVDEAMRLGYAWKWGPFELIDKLGADWLAEKLAADNRPVPALLKTAAGRKFYRIEGGKRQALGIDGEYHDIARADGVLMLEDIKLTSQPLLKNHSAALWDIGDGVACFEFTTKMNALDPMIMELLGKSIKLVAKQFKAMVVYNEGGNFSAGANLGIALFAANIAAYQEIEQSIAAGQNAYLALKYAPFPTVAAPTGLALGGGCEILLHSSAIQAHAESYIGLVECGVGLVPGWGGCKEMLVRWSANGHLPHGPMPAVAKVFETVSVATVSKSAAEAREHGFLREEDGITMNRYRLLSDAKAKALKLATRYKPPKAPEFTLPGPAGKTALGLAVDSFRKRGIATKHDVVVAGALAEVLSGGDTDPTKTLTEQNLLDLERERFMRLVRHPDTLARIESVLETGKPLRN
ncbi:MAG TPA: 3-hydroxyacyl-CoA dehydrogenase NAD-binding domain-containing protein [Magnetospirillaceae bacterium]|jgi:3-hydroxyacyl-CoA dehydrogenase